MREIRFRAWDKEEKTMVHEWEVKINFYEYVWSDEYEIMQYTWVDDNWWNPIFEWDIVRVQRYRKSMYSGKTIKDWCDGYRVIEWKTSRYWVWFNISDKTWYEVTVMGNIYEDKDILWEN